MSDVPREAVRITPQMRDMIRRRTDWILKDALYYDKPLRWMLGCAYLSGMNDAIDVLQEQRAREISE